ncbi:hypothetical protein HII13_001062 [Brettanomyces bruxellensis]|uniref:Mannosyltransferase n=1 Tax=Dekkera bruxellensis TaxID=5007 RepID=A0A7D9GY26_DEKBR|nr:hypothetical protein HII13_001062 [Brettanomyces bruxellensis]VUG16926.1 DEBR0S1_29118g1_1 [Brettanomyces bruxellensis]
MSNTNVGFLLTLSLIATRLYAVFNSIISDCDEVYNYWEPLNFLTRYFGKKTWEYQPEYSIRSWTYLLPYALLKYPLNWLQKSLELSGAFVRGAIPAYSYFYLVRLVLAVAFSFAECYLADALTLVSGELSNWFLIFEIFSPGVFQASVSLLPSSFALIFGMFSTASIIKYFRYDMFSHRIEDDFAQSIEKEGVSSKQEVENTEHSDSIIPDSTSDSIETSSLDTKPGQDNAEFKKLTTPQLFLCTLYKEALAGRDRYFALAVGSSTIGGIIGWPFCLVLTAPFVLYVVISILARKSPLKPLSTINSKRWALFIYFLAGIACVYMVTWTGLEIDSLFYNKRTIVPLNIVLYNVLHATKESGPNIFGIESSSYYFLNLLLNYHVIFLFAVANLLTFSSGHFKMGFKEGLAAYRLPLLLWLTIFTLQPHKEERFMFPAYHMISISAASFASKIFKIIVSKKKGICYHIARFVFLLVVVLGGILRITSLVENYGAPLSAFKALSSHDTIIYDADSTTIENVCIGREWYHYPSSFFLKSNQRLRYVENGFRGMLPGDFIEPGSHTFGGIRNSTRVDQEGFNNLNHYNPDFANAKLDQCDYFIDINMPVNADLGEISVFDEEGSSILPGWQTIRCEKMIDPDNSFGLAKLIHIPLNEIQKLKNYKQRLDECRVVKKVRASKVYSCLFDSKIYEFLMHRSIIQQIMNSNLYKHYVIASLSNYVRGIWRHLVSNYPGKVVYHNFCVARRV